MLRFLISLILLAASLASVRADIYGPFPGFEDLFKRADFVGIVTLTKRDPQEPSILIGSGRNFQIRSLVVFKGEPIHDVITCLADRRVVSDGEQFQARPQGEILTPEKGFLVFLVRPTDSDLPYKWIAINSEGAVLPVAAITNHDPLDVTKPFESFKKIVEDYTRQCKAEYEQAQRQQEIIRKITATPPPAEEGISIEKSDK